jgi:hypothetical protein
MEQQVDFVHDQHAFLPQRQDPTELVGHVALLLDRIHSNLIVEGRWQIVKVCVFGYRHLQIHRTQNEPVSH